MMSATRLLVKEVISRRSAVVQKRERPASATPSPTSDTAAVHEEL